MAKELARDKHEQYHGSASSRKHSLEKVEEDKFAREPGADVVFDG